MAVRWMMRSSPKMRTSRGADCLSWRGTKGTTKTRTIRVSAMVNASAKSMRFNMVYPNTLTCDVIGKPKKPIHAVVASNGR